jgi:hypothetical protein
MPLSFFIILIIMPRRFPFLENFRVFFQKNVTKNSSVQWMAMNGNEWHMLRKFLLLCGALDAAWGIWCWYCDTMVLCHHGIVISWYCPTILKRELLYKSLQWVTQNGRKVWPQWAKSLTTMGEMFDHNVRKVWPQWAKSLTAMGEMFDHNVRKV